MKIGFDAKRYFHNNSGLGNYSRDLVDTLVKQYPENRYFLFDASPSTLSLPANTIAAVPHGSHFMWRSYGIQTDIKLHGIDIYHGLSNELPFGKWPLNTKKVVTIHDVIFRKYPAHYALFDRKIYERKTRHALKVADRIVATSKSTAEDLKVLYGVDESRIQVIYQTCAEAHWKSYGADTLHSFAFNKRLPSRFILYVSSFQTRKNHLQLLKALKHSDRKDIQLVLAGRQGETYRTCLDYIEEHKLEKQVLIFNDLQNAELPLLYRCASSFIYPSMIEGFGIPLIEAACAGLPLAVNDIAVFRELAPKGTLMFEASETESLSKAMVQLNDMGKMNHSIYLERFKSSVAAEQMFALYQDCLK